MEFSPKEQGVIELCKRLKVVTKAELCRQLNISHMTVVRAFEKYEYYSSINHNSSYYTLKDIPKFNNYGLWFFKGVGFSRHKNINQSIIFIIDSSQCGYSEKEISKILQTKTGNILSRLVSQKHLSKIQKGRSVVYVSTKAGRNEKQVIIINRDKENEKTKVGDYNFSHALFPEDIEAGTVIATLVRLIEKPNSSVASLSLVLQGKGLKVTANEIREIISFYGLEKKTAQ